MQNWYDTSKETDEAKWTKPNKAMAFLRASLFPSARTVYKYSLGLRGEKLNYKSVAREVSKPLFFWFLKSSGYQSLMCLFDSRFCFVFEI